MPKSKSMKQPGKREERNIILISGLELGKINEQKF